MKKITTEFYLENVAIHINIHCVVTAVLEHN